MPVPSIPRVCDLPSKELKKIEVALKIFEDNFGKIHDSHGDGNCAYYTFFHVFKFVDKIMENRKLPSCAQNQKLLKQRERNCLSLDETVSHTLTGTMMTTLLQNLYNFFVMVIHIFLDCTVQILSLTRTRLMPSWRQLGKVSMLKSLNIKIRRKLTRNSIWRHRQHFLL